MEIKDMRILVMILFCTVVFGNIKAQNYTYYHDASKMNQITVMETGVGRLQPEFWYWLLSPVYRYEAAPNNKLGYRTTTALTANEQVEMAEAIDTSLVSRAKIEGLNVLDRGVDVAWLCEGDKITDAMNRFNDNITRLPQVPDGYAMKGMWQDEFDKFLCAIKSVQDAYMANYQRQEQYVKIYKEITQKNETLVKVMEVMKALAACKEWEKQYEKGPKPNVRSIVNESYEYWSDRTKAVINK